MKRSIGILAASLLWMGVASAQTAPECPSDNLIIGTGTQAGTYAQMFKEVASRCSMICENRQTQGGYDNLTKVMDKRFDGGITQVDTLELVNRSDGDVKKNVRSLISLHGSSMHIFVPREGVKTTVSRQVPKTFMGVTTGTDTVIDTVYVPVRSLQDLKGKTVAAWSSAFVTATIMNERLQLGMDVIEVKTRPEGWTMLEKGEVWAFMGMGGKPLDWVEGINGSKPEADPKKHVLLNVSNDDLTRMGNPYYGVKVTYRSIGALGINTVTVRNDIVVWNIQKGSRVKAITDFQACFKANLDEIQGARGSHASWSDVSADTPLGWEPYKAPASIGAVK